MRLFIVLFILLNCFVINSKAVNYDKFNFVKLEKINKKKTKNDTLFGLNLGLNLRTFNFLNFKPKFNVQQYLTLTPLLKIKATSNYKNKYFFTFKYGIGKFKSEVNFAKGYKIPFVENAYGMIIQQNGNIRYTAFEFGYNIYDKKNIRILLNLSMGAFIFKRKNIRNLFLTTTGTSITNYSAIPMLRNKYDNSELNSNLNFEYKLNKRIFIYCFLGFSFLPSFSQRVPLEEGNYNLYLITNSIGLSFKI